MPVKTATAKKVPRSQRAAAGIASSKKAAPSAKAVKTIEVRVGAVSVTMVKPTREEVKRNVLAGQEAFARMQSRLVRPGVTLKMPPDVPLYHADPDNSGLLIRTIGNKTATGRFVGGKFKVVDTSRAGKKAAA